METTNIRAHGSRAYWDSVAVLARQMGMTTAKFVKQTMDSAHGEKLAKLAPLFDPDDAEQHRKHQEAEHA